MNEDVIAILGDSPAPSLAALQIPTNGSYYFLFTQDNKTNQKIMDLYCKTKHPEKKIQFVELPSITKVEETVKILKEIGLQFLSKPLIIINSGAKQIILPLLVHLPKSTIVETFHSPLRLVSNEEYGLNIAVNLTLFDFLASRLWSYNEENQTLSNPDVKIRNIIPEFNSNKGQLTFQAISMQKKENYSEFFKLNQKTRKKVQSRHQRLIESLITLEKSFGRNGANYHIIGKLSPRTKSTLPGFVQNLLTLEEEE